MKLTQLKYSELTPDQLLSLQRYFCQVENCEGLIEPLPSGTFTTCGICPDCKSWYGHEGGFGKRGFYLNNRKDTWALDHKNNQLILMGMEPIII